MTPKGWFVVGLTFLIFSALFWVGIILAIQSDPIDLGAGIAAGAILTAAPIGIGIYALWRSKGLRGERFCPVCGFISTTQYCPNDGTEMKLRQALQQQPIQFSQLQEEPGATPSEVPPPAEKGIPRWGKVGLVVSFLFLITVVALALAGQPTPEPTPEDGSINAIESAYFASSADILGDGADSLDRVLGIVNTWVPGVNDNTILRKLDVELSIMKSIRDRVNNLAIPCSAYSGMHSDIVSAFDNYVSAYEWTILAIETYDYDVLDTSVDFFRQGNEDLGRGETGIALLQETVPNC